MDIETIRHELVSYLQISNPLIGAASDVPLDTSLVELGLMDSFGVVDMVVFIEKKYGIKIEDSEITKEKFGSVNKMSQLILDKIHL